MINRHICLGLGGLCLVLALAALGCENKAPAVAETPPPPVTVSQPVVRDVIDYDSYEGRIGAVETVDVRARVRGHLIKVNFEDGQMVKPGELLFEIDPRPYQAELDAQEAQVAAADAALDLATKEYKRASSLLRSNAASREEVDVWLGKQGVAKAEKLKAQAAVERAKLDLDFTKVTAPEPKKIDDNGKAEKKPFLWRASRAQVTVGNLINASGGETLLTTLVSTDPMYVYFDVPERALLRYRHDFSKAMIGEGGARISLKEMKIPVYVALEGQEGYPYQGFLDFSDNKVNPSTGTIQARGVLKNPQGSLDAGMRARVRVPASPGANKALLVTERAVGTDQNQRFLYVVNDQNVVERRDVELGRLTDGLQAVPNGLKPDDWVIVNGIQRVRDGMKVDPKRQPMPGAKAQAGAANEPTKSGGKS